MGEIQLKNWAMRPSFGGVRVDGLRVDDASGIYWHSSSIVKRINGRLLETNSRSRYRLLGDLDEIYAKEVSGYLYSLIRQFKRGFPKKWKSFIESAERATAANCDDGMKRKVSETFREPDSKTPSRQNVAGKQSKEALGSVRPVSGYTNKRAVLSNKRIAKETPEVRRHSVTRLMTKKLEESKTRNMSESEGSSLEDSFSGTLLSLRSRHYPPGRTLRKRKQPPSDVGSASKKRKVEGRSVGQGLRSDCFPTPEFQNDDVVLDSFSSQRKGLRKRGRMLSTTIEPDILTLEGLLSPPEDSRPRKMVPSQRIILNPVVVPFDLGEEFEEDILEKSFLETAQADLRRNQRKLRSQTTRSKQQRATTKQRKSKLAAPSTSPNAQPSTKSPGLTLNFGIAHGGHNLRARTVKKDTTPGPRGKSETLGSKSRSRQKKHLPSENTMKCTNNNKITLKATKSDAVTKPEASHKAVTSRKAMTSHKPVTCRKAATVKSHLGKDRALQVSENCDEDLIVGTSVATESLSSVQQRIGEAGNGVAQNCQNQTSLMPMVAKQMPTAEMLHHKKPEEKEENNDVIASELGEKKQNEAVDADKITSIAQEVGTVINQSSSSMTYTQDSSVAHSNSPQIIQVQKLHHVTSTPIELSENRNRTTVSVLTEKGEEAISSEKAKDKVSCLAQTNDTRLKSPDDRQITETPYSCGTRGRSIRSSVRQNELKIKNQTRRFAHKINTAETNGESPERISRPVETLKPKESKVMASKKRNARKKESKGAVVTMPNKIENGQRSLSIQRPCDQLEENMSSKTKVIPLLPENSLVVEVEAVEECCLAKCSVENVEVDTNGLTLKRTKKRSRKVAEIPVSVISVKNQSEKSQFKSNKEQTKKDSEMNDSILAKKNDQIINVKLLGGRGTLKRQRELRKLVEKNMHCKDNNDFFSSTPFQSPRAKRFVFPQFEEDDDIFAEGDLSKALNCEWADVTPHGLFRVMDYTANKTPTTATSTPATPAGVKRSRGEQEAYIHRIKKMLHLGQRKGCAGRNIPKSRKANYESAAGSSKMPPVLSVDKDVFEVKEVREKDSEEEEEEDYYFADD